ncbi:membrane-associated protein, putative [Bodo saltans]|uniref:Membrane-associated protein, putative n=1 Tax=Bodo saltans TaxID=75058 RepID=A0A0S4JUX4_BODSA|nr:membrane-associated protein, putative [Bodo saltans]|eukprot:CUG94360.1 membrane-associated protein, putative [Bodo saltans]
MVQCHYAHYLVALCTLFCCCFYSLALYFSRSAAQTKCLSLSFHHLHYPSCPICCPFHFLSNETKTMRRNETKDERNFLDNAASSVQHKIMNSQFPPKEAMKREQKKVRNKK